MFSSGKPDDNVRAHTHEEFVHQHNNYFTYRQYVGIVVMLSVGLHVILYYIAGGITTIRIIFKICELS